MPENIYKLIYSRSHRNASWQEMYTANNRASFEDSATFSSLEYFTICDIQFKCVYRLKIWQLAQRKHRRI